MLTVGMPFLSNYKYYYTLIKYNNVNYAKINYSNLYIAKINSTDTLHNDTYYFNYD